MRDLHIRRATADDRATVRRFIDLLQDAEAAMHPSRRSAAMLAPHVVDELMRRGSGDDGAILLAERDGAAVGYIAFYAERHESLELIESAHRFLYIADLCVDPASRGQGIAGLLLAEAEAACRRLGLPRLQLGVLAANPSARSSYDRAGYVPYELWLEKRIAASPVPARPVAGLVLRPPREDDRAILLSFLRGLFDDEANRHWALRPGSAVTLADVDRNIAEIAAENGVIVIAELDGRPVGYAGAVLQDAVGEFELKDEWTRRGFITDMYVAPEGRRRGVALALLAACEQHVANAGVDWLQIYVAPDNAPATALYHHAGFRDYEWVLEKRLTA